MGARCIHCGHESRKGYSVALTPLAGCGEHWQCVPRCIPGDAVARYIAFRKAALDASTVNATPTPAPSPLDGAYVLIDYNRPLHRYTAVLRNNGGLIAVLYIAGQLEPHGEQGEYFALHLSSMYNRTVEVAKVFGVRVYVEGSARRALAEIGIHPE